MKKLLLDALVKPFFAIAFCLLFGAGFIFAGYQTIMVSSEKGSDGNVVFAYTQEHFWGYLKFPHRMEGVNKAEVARHKGRRKHGHRTTTTSTVALVSDTERRALIGGSNLDQGIKNDMVERINAYLQNPQEYTFSGKWHIRNVFYWVGLPFFLIGMVGLVGWPKSIMDSIIAYRRNF